MTEPEESVLVEMMVFFNDMGWINESTQAEYDSLCEKIAEPSPFDYEPYEETKWVLYITKKSSGQFTMR